MPSQGRIGAAVPKFIANDFGRKAVSVAFAILVWFGVRIGTGVEDRVGKVAVDLVVPPELVVVGEPPAGVTLRVRAGGKRMSQIHPDNFVIRKSVDERGFAEGEPYQVRLSPNDVQAPFGVSVLDIEPNVLSVNLDRKLSRQLPVTPRFTGMLPQGYARGEVATNPPMVTVSGARGIVQTLKTIATEPIALDKTLLESFDMQVDLVVPRGVAVSPTGVLARVEVSRVFISREFKLVPIRVLEPTGRAGFQTLPLTTPHVAVTISGDKGVVEQIKPENIKAFVDLSPFREPGSYNVPVECWATDARVTVERIQPAQVTVSLRRDEEPPPTAKD